MTIQVMAAVLPGELALGSANSSSCASDTCMGDQGGCSGDGGCGEDCVCTQND
jgi:hypothetical protein